jgi:hypothetical protein
MHSSLELTCDDALLVYCAGAGSGSSARARKRQPAERSNRRAPGTGGWIKHRDRVAEFGDAVPVFASDAPRVRFEIPR